METLEAMKKRRSTRAYTGEKVSDGEVSKLIEAANAAPVGVNLKENLRITVIRDEALLDAIRAGAERDLTYGAPLLVIVSAKTDERFGPELDAANVSCVLENILVEATDLGLGSVYLWGITRAVLPRHPEIRAQLRLPEGFEPFAAAAIGHAAPSAPLGEHKEIAVDII